MNLGAILQVKTALGFVKRQGEGGFHVRQAGRSTRVKQHFHPSSRS